MAEQSVADTVEGPPLIGLAHGSRDPAAAEVITDLMAAVASARPGLRTTAAFLDLSEPDLTSAMRTVGEAECVVLPLLFTQAFHARVDTPEAVAEAAEETGTRATVGDILGLGEEILEAMTTRALLAGIPDDEPIALAAVGSGDEAANAAVAAFAARWQTQRGATVTACFATAGQPKTAEVIPALSGRGGVAPLFLAPGLLLRGITDLAIAAGVPVAEPLGALTVSLVLDRYDQAVRQRNGALPE